MSLVILPDNTDDNKVYDSIRDVSHTEADNQTIDMSIPFRLAERAVVQALPQMELPNGRNYTERPDGLLALICITGGYMLRAGGRTASGTSESETTFTGEVQSESEQYGSVRVTRNFRSGTSTSDVRSNRQSEVPATDQGEFLIQQGIDILQALGGETGHISPDPSEIIPTLGGGLTRSHLDCPPGQGQQGQSSGGQQGTGKELPVEGELTYVEEEM